MSAAAAYTAIAVAMTWPLAAGIAHVVAGDLGDPILNIWILAWDWEQFRGIFFGHYAHLWHFFDANIFHPAPLTLAYSEHLVPQALQVFPLYAITSNPILCYNLLFLSTFALSGLGMFLLLHELTGSVAASFVAGLLFAFAPYRVPQSSHLQVLSSQWMPFALYGFRRYAEHGRIRALAGATASVVLQGLSCGYYLLYFSPFAGAYAIWELWRVGRLHERRVWLHLAAAGIAAALVVLPFLIPYVHVSRDLQLTRSLGETTRLSADVYSYVTASVAQRFWGSRLSDVFPKPEGELFPGLVPVVLALIGVLFFGTHKIATEASPGWRTPAARALWIVALVHVLAACVTVIFRRVALHLWLFDLRLVDATQLLLRAAVAYGAALALSAGLRQRAAAFMRSRGFFAVALLAAAWLSLGPAPRVLGRPLELASPYGFLWNHLPGFDGLRVPARFAMVVVLMLSVLGGLGAAVMARHRAGRIVLTLLAAVFLFEAGASPFLVNGMFPVPDFNGPPAELAPPTHPPAVYTAVSRLPASAVLAELPFGQYDYDLRAMYYSIDRWRPILNGYSGFFPPHYGRAVVALTDVPRHPDVSMEALRELGATHVVIHEGAYRDTEGRETTAALEGLGATETFRDGGDVLLSLVP
jgi:hypothetical protein